MQITFPVQAEQMQIPHLTDDELMPISWISLGDSIMILREYFSLSLSIVIIIHFILLVGILILILFVYKYLNQWNRSISIQIKLVIGMFFAAMAMFIAGIIEIIRQNYCLPSIASSREKEKNHHIRSKLIFRCYEFITEYSLSTSTKYLYRSIGNLCNDCQSRICISRCSTFWTNTFYEFTILFIRNIIYYWQRLSFDLYNQKQF